MQSNVYRLGGNVGVLGYGVDGRCVCEFLEGVGEVEKVIVFDDQMNNVQCTINNEGRLFVGEDLEGVDLLFRSPGFPLDHKWVLEAKEKGIPITSSTAYFLQNYPGTVVGVTGSNGKTTCVALITEMLKAEFGEGNVERGGNDGVPRLDLIERERERGKGKKGKGKGEKAFVVLELSSFQLIDCPVSPDVAVVLNITPNHLNWHASMEEYSEAKRQIVAHKSGKWQVASGKCDAVVLNEDDPIVNKFADNIRSDVHWFRAPNAQMPKCPNALCKTHPSTFSAVITTARALKVSEENITKVLQTFPGVPHRLEFIREIDGVKYYNDSSCTTPESAITACEAFPEGSVILLLGGRDKGMDFSRLYEVIKERKVRVVPYGEMAEVFKTNIPAHLPLATAHLFVDVIQAARAAASAGDNVVFSPACASFDMFQNAKERGKEFRKIVEELQ